MGALLKKEYRLSLVLIIAFGLLLFTIDKTSEQIVSHFAEMDFRYERPAFLKLVYLVVLFITIASLIKLDSNTERSSVSKKKAFENNLFISVFCFFVGWIIHLYFVFKTLTEGGSFMRLEDQFWIYYCADILFILGFSISSLIILRPAIHTKE